eukprot:5396942-Pleurochrysis_carterae.AAC.4
MCRAGSENKMRLEWRVVNLRELAVSAPSLVVPALFDHEFRAISGAVGEQDGVPAERACCGDGRAWAAVNECNAMHVAGCL